MKTRDSGPLEPEPGEVFSQAIRIVDGRLAASRCGVERTTGFRQRLAVAADPQYETELSSVEQIDASDLLRRKKLVQPIF